MTDPTYGAATKLASLCHSFQPSGSALPALFAFTDPVRTPDPVKLAQSLPPGTGLILRTFGDQRLVSMAPLLAAIAEHRRVTFLVAADPELAKQVGADGVHWPESQLRQASRARVKGIQTASAHSPSALRCAQNQMDAVFVSTAFASRSPSASRSLGPFRLASYAKRSRIPVFALGGVNKRTAQRLTHTGIYGAAAIEGLMDEA
ncbi:thiamine phosphate synthase [Maricaulaceae bacterium NA33B04]|nr:thiamine phosphate synthase [Maricaulaceae bacterium NA33B04]